MSISWSCLHKKVGIGPLALTSVLTLIFTIVPHARLLLTSTRIYKFVMVQSHKRDDRIILVAL
jgi:hypothetical protein